MDQTADFLVVGAGIVGLTTAIELMKRFPESKVIVIEKERQPGLHSSGRNSGVLHSGIYYPPNTLKAKVCSVGAKELSEYCIENKLPLLQCGKLLVATSESDSAQMEHLYENAKASNINTELLDDQQLRSIEPEAFSKTGKTLFVSSTSVGSSLSVMNQILIDARKLGIQVLNNMAIDFIKINKKLIEFQNGDKIHFGHLINTAGLHADSIAHEFRVGTDYTILPFKGIYWKLNNQSKIKINHLIYPVPDLRVPFLGVHATISTNGEIYFGPTAVPAFGRENYRGIMGLDYGESLTIISTLLNQVIEGRNGFRRLAWIEGRRMFKHWFLKAAKSIIPNLEAHDLVNTSKVGIRAQLFDQKKKILVSDFLIEDGQNSTHVLNAISPAWTSSFPFARYLVDHITDGAASIRDE